MKYNITAAIIGTGFMGKQYAAILDKIAKNIILCSTDEATGKALAAQYGCKFYSDYIKMFKNERIDFAAICLPTHLHYSVSKTAMEHGINVLCEKPFASSEAEAMEMMETAEEKELLFMVAHCLRFSKSFEYLRRCISDERFGKLISYSSHRESPSPSWSIGNWLANTALSGGVVRDLHIHDTDMIVGLLGMPKSVYTVGSTTACRTVYSYDRNISVSASASWRNVQGFPMDTGADVVFESACVKISGEKITVYTDNSCFDPLEKEEFCEFFANDIYTNEIKYFCHCLTNKQPPLLCPASDSLKTIAVSCAESRSLEKHAEETILKRRSICQH